MILPLGDIRQHLETVLLSQLGVVLLALKPGILLNALQDSTPNPHKELPGPNAIIVKVEKHTFQAGMDEPGE